MLQSIARELLVRLTHVGNRTPVMMRSRIAAIDNDPDAANYIHTAIKELAAYGIFLRDNTEPLQSRVMQRAPWQASPSNPNPPNDQCLDPPHDTLTPKAKSSAIQPPL